MITLRADHDTPSSADLRAEAEQAGGGGGSSGGGGGGGGGREATAGGGAPADMDMAGRRLDMRMDWIRSFLYRRRTKNYKKSTGPVQVLKYLRLLVTQGVINYCLHHTHPC